MRILVTGGTGFLGRHVVWRAAREGASVVFTGRRAEWAAEVLRDASGPVRWLPLDHGTPDAAARLAAGAIGCDAIVHCAALSSPWGARADFERANVQGTREVVQAALQAGVRRLVHVSTPSLYFAFRDALDIRESDPLPPPVNHYARTKRAAEAVVRGSAVPEVVLLRPRALFGPWDRTLMPRLLRAMATGPLPLMRGGRAQLDLTCVDNAVDAVWLALTRPLPRPGAVYNVSNGDPRPLSELLERMAAAFSLSLRTRPVPWPLVSATARALEWRARLGGGAEPPWTRYSAGVLAFSQTLNVDAIRADLGYRPAVPLDEGLQRHAHWWRAQQP